MEWLILATYCFLVEAPSGEPEGRCIPVTITTDAKTKEDCLRMANYLETKVTTDPDGAPVRFTDARCRPEVGA